MAIQSRFWVSPLTRANEQAAKTLPSDEAWNFLSAMIRKLQGRPMPSGRRALLATAEALAGWAPTGGVALLAQTEPDSASRYLVPSIAAGIAASNHGLEERFRDACPEVKERVSRSVERGPIGTLVKKINGSICQISEAIGHKPIAS